MTSYWNWASVEAEIWSRVRLFTIQNFSICSLYFIKIWKGFIILTMKRREVWTDRVFKRVTGAALFPSLCSPLGLCHVFFDHVFFDHVFFDQWPCLAGFSRRFGGLFQPPDSSRSPWDSYLSSKTPSRAPVGRWQQWGKDLSHQGRNDDRRQGTVRSVPFTYLVINVLVRLQAFLVMTTDYGLPFRSCGNS